MASATILTEDSPTRLPGIARRRASEYFQGAFQEVATLARELGDVLPTQLLIATAENGLVSGDEYLPLATNAGREDAFATLHRRLHGNAGFFVFLLTGPSWHAIMQRPRLGLKGNVHVVAGRQLESQIREFLSPESEVHFYHRVGVARVGSKNKAAILADARLLSAR